jgi:hypothetical protein
LTRAALMRRKFPLMADTDPRAKYGELPPNVDDDDLVAKIDASELDQAHSS